MSLHSFLLHTRDYDGIIRIQSIQWFVKSDALLKLLICASKHFHLDDIATDLDQYCYLQIITTAHISTWIMIDAAYRYAKCRGCFASEKPVFNVSDCQLLPYIGSYPEYNNVGIGRNVYYIFWYSYSMVKCPIQKLLFIATNPYQMNPSLHIWIYLCHSMLKCNYRYMHIGIIHTN